MSNDTNISWERFLNPEILRTNLIIASLYIAAFEMLKDSIIERIRSFFTNGFDESGWIVSKDYEVKVLSLNKSPVYASLEWLKNMEVVEDQDIDDFNKIKNCRNELAHEITSFVSKGARIDPLPLFSTMTELLHKIEKWWILNVEIPTDPEFDDEEINEEEILPGKVMILRLLTDIALGSEEESKFYYTEFNKRNNNN